MRIIAAMTAAAAVNAAALAEESSTPPDATAHAFRFQSIDGGPLPMDAYADQVVLVVNTASRCGFTPQYEGLQTLWETYQNAGLVVLGVPSDAFNQELSTDAEVKEFCEVTYGIDFPMTDITEITGENSHPFYAWARDALGDTEFPSWNFNKVLIGRGGEAIVGFSSVDSPNSPTVVRAIEAALDAGA